MDQLFNHSSFIKILNQMKNFHLNKLNLIVLASLFSTFCFAINVVNAKSVSKRKHTSHSRRFKKACKHLKAKRFKKAHKHLKGLAEKGDAKAQTLLGLLYEKGVGVEKDVEKALSYYEKAALQGLPEAESALGHLLLSLEKDSEVVSLKTANWLKKAAVHGQIEAKVTLGKIALDVKNSPIAQNEAVWHLRDAAKKGNDQAKSMLARMPKLPSSRLGNPAQQVSAGVQAIPKSFKGYSDLANIVKKASGSQK